MRAYSLDLRHRVLAALDRGMARRDVVTTFGVSLGTIKRLVAQRRLTNDVTPKRAPGRPRSIRPAQHTALWTQLETHADAPLDEQAQLWNATHGTALSARTLGRAIARLGWTRKKRRWQPPNATRCSGSSGATE